MCLISLISEAIGRAMGAFLVRGNRYVNALFTISFQHTGQNSYQPYNVHIPLQIIITFQN